MSTRAGGSYQLRKIYQRFEKQILTKYAARIGPIDVWVVDGFIIRNQIYIDYTEGGNGEAYVWMPKNHIWLDCDVHPDEQHFVLLHELSEMNFMRWDKLDYDPAHIKANVLELEARRHPTRFLDIFEVQKQIMINNSK